jgi:hypothetical protein
MQPSTPTIEFTDDDGNVYYGQEALERGDAWIASMEAHNRRVLAQLKTHELARFEAWLRTRKRTTQPVRPRAVAVVVPRRNNSERRPAGSRRTSSSSRTSSADPGSDADEPEPPAGGFELTLVDETPAGQPPRRYCHCDRDRPYTAPNWEIEPDGGHCRACGHELRDSDVRRWLAVAYYERQRVSAKGWGR